MTYRSKLFATVAMPWLALAVAVPPALAKDLTQAFELAQAEGQPADGGPSQEELLLLQQQQAAEEEAKRQAAEEEAKRQAEQQAAEEQQRQAEQQAAEEQQRQAEQQAAEEQKRQAEQQAAEEQQRQAEQQAAEEQQRQAEQQAAEEQKRQAEQQAAEEQQRQAEQQAAEEQKRQAEQQAAEEQQRQAEQQAAEEQKRQAEQKAAEEAQQQQQQQQTADPCAVPEGAERPADCPVPAPAPDQAEQPAQQPPVNDQAQQPADPAQQPPADQAQQPAAQPPVTDQAQQPADPAQQPPADQQAQQPAPQPVEPVVDNRTEEQKQQIAADPASTNDTIVLPVENGAAVLDSDKDADLQGGQAAREQRRALREEVQAQEQAPPPTTDADAQAALAQEGQTVDPATVKARLTEEGTRVQEAPQFAVPQTTNIINNTVINNTVINNTTNNTEVNNTTNNTVVNNNNTVINNEVTQVRVEQQVDNRTVLAVGDRIIVRGDERPRLRRDSQEVYYDELSRGRTRETIVRENGVQIVTVYNRYGDVIQRSRIGRDGEEYLLIYAPEADEGPRRPQLVDVGYELPPMRLRIPVSDYIVDYSEEPNRDYYEFLSEPPVERVERVYTIDEVRTSARLRDKVRRIDLDTITFATGSAEVSMTQAKTMRKVADAMSQILKKDPGETFFIEGHTDAVGSDQSNLILSDKRAESVAVLLTEVYGIPPENLVTQGYGERFLKVRTSEAEQQNRRVTIRRVTPLVRPVAQAN